MIKITQQSIFSVFISITFAVIPMDAFCLAREFDFGRIPYGKKIRAVPSWAEKSSCGIKGERFDDCSFFDNRGVEYIVFDGVVSSKTITITSRFHWVPYGIFLDRPEREVVASLQTRLHVHFKIYPQDSKGLVQYISEPIGEHSGDGPFVVLEFTRAGQLSEIRLTSDYT